MKSLLTSLILAIFLISCASTERIKLERKERLCPEAYGPIDSR